MIFTAFIINGQLFTGPTTAGTAGQALVRGAAAGTTEWVTPYAASGSGTQLQHFSGAVTGSSWNGTTLTLPKTTIDGNFGIGTSNPIASFGRYLEISDAVSAGFALSRTGGTAQKYTIGANSDRQLGFYDETAAIYRILIAPTTGNVGIATPAGPGARLDVSGGSSDKLRLTSTDTSGEGLDLQWYSMQSGDNKITAEIESDGASTGGNLSFKTRSVAGILTDRVLIGNDGNFLLGLTSSPTGGGTPVVVLNNAVSDPTGMPSNSAGIYAKAGELWGVDAAGNASLQTPHPTDAPATMYDDVPGREVFQKTIQQYRGIVAWKNLTRGLKLAMLTPAQRAALTPAQRVYEFAEPFAAYNSRTGNNLVKQNWDAHQQDQATKRTQEQTTWDARQTEWLVKMRRRASLPRWLQGSAIPQPTNRPATYTPQPAPAAIGA